MDWLLRMNRALDYIESNLTGEIELKEVARSACCSSHQFQRMFSFITNVSLAEYIRRRHGVNPASASEEWTALKAYPRLSFLISTKGEKAMNYRIETKESFHVFGIEKWNGT